MPAVFTIDWKNGQEMVKVTFVSAQGTECSVEAETGMTLMEAARNNGVQGIVAECGGACSCSTCHVYIRDEWLPLIKEITSTEAEMLEFAPERDIKRSRLSCQIILGDQLDGMVVDIPAIQL